MLVKQRLVQDWVKSIRNLKRQNVVSRSLNVKIYNAKYFGYKIQNDQNEKLGMLGWSWPRAIQMDFPVK